MSNFLQIVVELYQSMFFRQSLDRRFFLQVFLVTMILIICPSHVACIAKSFQLATLPNGSSLCVVNTPSYSMSVGDIIGLPAEVPSALRCALQCTAGLCGAFNYYKHRELCQFFNTLSSCSVKQNCSLYQVQIL